VDLRTEDIKKLSRADLETLAAGIDGYPLGRAGAAKDEMLYRLPVFPRCGRVIREAYHVWGIGDAGILFSQRTGSGGAAALGTPREGTCVPAGSDDREHARGDGA